MRYTSFFLLATLAIAMSVKTNTQANMQLQNQMKKLQKTSWGQVAASFLDLQMAVGSPVADLVQAFQDFFRDNQFKVDINTQDFNWQLNQHNGWVKDFEDQIASAQNDIAQTTSHLNNVLYPLKQQLEEQLVRDEALIVKTLAEMASATSERAKNSEDHAVYVEEAQAAIGAIDECLDLLAGLDSGTPSLIQVTKVQKSLKKVGETLKKTKFSSLIKALLKLADFANSEMLTKLRARFSEVRAEMVAGIAFALEEEEDQLAAYTTFMGISQTTVDDARQRIVENTAALEQCVQDIADGEAFREQRIADLAQAEADLAAEHARWDKVVIEFDALFAQLASEQEAIGEVIDICTSISVSDETMARLDQ